ncbi:MAG: SBBP repeat-containing protein [Ignavibacteria bacterium]|jgi:hypothetical protein
MKISTLSIFFLFILLSVTLSQIQQEWVQRYNGSGNGSDGANALAVDYSGNVFVTGWSVISTGADYTTIKYNIYGGQLWAERYNGPANANDFAFAIATDALGNIYVTGTSPGNGTGNDIATIKYTTGGAQTWVQRYNGDANSDDFAYSITVDGEGNVYVSGGSTVIGSGLDMVTIKYNTSGVQQWVKRYNGPGNSDDYSKSMAVDNWGNVYVTGPSIGSILYGKMDYATIKYNSAGVQQWVQRYNGPADSVDVSVALKIGSDNSIYVTGYSIGNGTSTDYATIKYNSSGIQQWVQRYSSAGNYQDEAIGLAIDTSNSDIYVTGSTIGFGSFWNFATVKYNSSGVQQWVQIYYGQSNKDNKACSITTDGYGNVFVLGYTTITSGLIDYATVKYNSNGNQQAAALYGTFYGNSFPTAIVTDGFGGIFVTGESYYYTSGNDYLTIKYSEQVRVKKISSDIPDNFHLSQNYPNPFNPTTKIKFDIPPLKGVRGMGVRLIISDLLGREVTTLINEQLKPGTYEAEWDASNYPSGVYFYKLITDNYNEARKMVLVK